MDERIVSNLILKDKSWAYTATQGYEPTRKFLAEKVNERRGAQITADDLLFLTDWETRSQKFSVL